MSDFETVIGLEVHAQIATGRKLFCRCRAIFDAPPNEHVCPVCLGLPGALPVVDQAAVDLALRAGLALGCAVRARSVFARKSYFYPDLAKGYQITQYERPVLEHGELVIDARTVRIQRIHLEEDAAKSSHVGAETRVDYGRAGSPLMEIVTHPDLRSGAEAEAYLRELRAVLLHVGACDGNLEQGSFRCDANVSIRRRGDTTLGARVELKNINSFRFVRQAIEHEAARQRAVVSAGGTIDQETRGWDEGAQTTFVMRSKEDAHDYRYFPDPDLPVLRCSEARVEAARAALPELPAALRARLMAELDLDARQVEPLVAHPGVARFVDEVLAAVPEGERQRVARFVLNEVCPKVETEGLRATLPVPVQPFVELMGLLAEGKVHATAAKEVFSFLVAGERDPGAVVEREGLGQIADAEGIAALAREAVAAHPAQAEQYRDGKTKVLGFFVGQVMKASQGRANPQAVREALIEALA